MEKKVKKLINYYRKKIKLDREWNITFEIGATKDSFVMFNRELKIAIIEISKVDYLKRLKYIIKHELLHLKYPDYSEKEIDNLAKHWCLKLTDIYHEYWYRPFIRKLTKTKIGVLIERVIIIFFRILWVFNITQPPKGEAPCFTYIFFRSGYNRYKSLTFKEKISYLKSFIKKF